MNTQNISSSFQNQFPNNSFYTQSNTGNQNTNINNNQPNNNNYNFNSSYAALLSNNPSFLQNNGDNQPNQIKSKNTEIISKSIVYGSIAFWLGKKSEQNLTHKWCVYVRGNNNEDISYFVKEVVFTLHATFENNVRTLTKWPFELYASGWGEFDIKITIHLIDQSIKPIEFIHFLKLYPPANQTPSTKKPIVSEFFDEIVFVNPKKFLREQLVAGSSNTTNLKKDTNIQIPINTNKFEDDKKSIYSNQEENKSNFNTYVNSNILENKMENLNLNYQLGLGNMNSYSHEDQVNEANNKVYSNVQLQNDIELENFEQNQSLNHQGNNVNLNNNDSMSVFSNNINVRNYKLRNKIYL